MGKTIRLSNKRERYQIFCIYPTMAYGVVLLGISSISARDLLIKPILKVIRCVEQKIW